jgi:hypothetical protein
MLTAIKLLHTLIWALPAASILALPVLAMLHRFRWAAIVSGIVLLECGVLALNGGRCPLTDFLMQFLGPGCKQPSGDLIHFYGCSMNAAKLSPFSPSNRTAANE